MKKSLLLAASLVLPAVSSWAALPGEGIITVDSRDVYITPAPYGSTAGSGSTGATDVEIIGTELNGKYTSLNVNRVMLDTELDASNDFTDCVTVTSPSNQTYHYTPTCMTGRLYLTWTYGNIFDEIGVYTVDVDLSNITCYGTKLNLKINYEYRVKESTVSTDYMDLPSGAYFDKGMNDEMTAQATGDLMPGTYKKIKGMFELLLTNVYTKISGLNTTSSGPKAYVLKDGKRYGNEYSIGDYSGNGTDVYFSVSPAITEPGEYYLVYPFEGCTATTFGSEEVAMHDMKVGPYIIEPKPDPVDAQLTFAPTGEFEFADAPAEVTVTVSNGTLSNALFDGVSVTKTNGENEATVINGRLSGNSVIYSVTGITAGEWTVTVPFTNYKGETAEGAELVFPANPATWTFTVKEEVKPEIPSESVIPAGITVSPEPGQYEEVAEVTATFTSEYGGGFNQLLPEGTMGSGKPVATVVYPDGSSKDIDCTASDKTLSISPALTEPGDYVVTIDFSDCMVWVGNMPAKPTENNKIVLLYTISASEPVNVIPDGVTLDPVPGTYAEVKNIKATFDENFIAGFIQILGAGFNGSEAPVATITGPEGTSTVTATISGKSINVYSNLTKVGDYVVSIDLTKTKFFIGTDFIYPTNDKGTVVLLYTIGEPVAPEAPELSIGSDVVTDATYGINEGETVTVTLAAEGSTVYYKWTAAPASGEALRIEATDDFVEYSEALAIDGAGTLEYYARKGDSKSEIKSITFTVNESETPVLPEIVKSIAPAPGRYQSWAADQKVTVTLDAYAIMGGGKTLVTVKDNDGNSRTVTAEWDMSTLNAISFAPAFEMNKKYTVTVDFNVNGVQIYKDNSGSLVTVPAFTFEYTVGTVTGVDEVAADDAEAEYYTISGVRVNGGLTPGIYVKKTGDKVTKVIVR